MVQRARDVRDGAKRPESRKDESRRDAGRKDVSLKDQKPAAVPMGDAGQRLAALEAERDRLKASLAEAEARIAELEKTRAVVVNRIDWLIDSLGGAIEKRA